MKIKIVLSLTILSCMLLLGIVPSVVAQEGDEVPSFNSFEYDATLANDWILFVYELVRDEEVSAPAAARIYAYTSVALYEGVVNGMPENFSIGGQIEGFALPPFPDMSLEWDWSMVANSTLSNVAHQLFADSDDEIHERIDTMREEQIAMRLETIDAEIVERSVAFGDDLGAQLVDWIATDNYGPTRKIEYELPEGDAAWWQPTSEGMVALEPYWNQIRPFGLNFSSQCNVDMQMDFSTNADSTFYAQSAEVVETSDNLTDEQREIARFWIDTPGVSGAPSGHWMLIGMQISEQHELSLGRTAEMYVLLGMALHDAFISAWDKKYTDNLVRPVTYINANIRRGWSPYLETPPFPEYPSGHSVASGAAAEVLTTMFGQVAFDDATPIINGHENVQRSFTSFEQAADEAAISRLYGGIHYRAAIELGKAQGRCVAGFVLNNVRLRSVPQGE